MKLTLSSAATAAVTGVTPEVLTAGVDRDTHIGLTLPRLAKRPQLAVWC